MQPQPTISEQPNQRQRQRRPRRLPDIRIRLAEYSRYLMVQILLNSTNPYRMFAYESPNQPPPPPPPPNPTIPETTIPIPRPRPRPQPRPQPQPQPQPQARPPPPPKIINILHEDTTRTDKFYYGTECAICYKKPRIVGVLECGHAYCKTCILKDIKQSGRCPLCRREYDLVIIQKVGIKTPEKSAKSAKK